MAIGLPYWTCRAAAATQVLLFTGTCMRSLAARSVLSDTAGGAQWVARRRVYRRRMLKPGLVSARRAPFPSRAPSASRVVFAFHPGGVFRRPRAGQRDFPCAAAWRLACSWVPMQAPPAWAPGPARLDWLQPSAQEAARSD